MRAIPESLLNRARQEYREMPGLMLTKWQACRLWNLEAEICEALLVELVREEFLARTRTGAYLWRGREPARSSQAAAETMN